MAVISGEQVIPLISSKMMQNVFLRVILTKWHFLTYFLTFYLAFTFFNTGWHSIVHVISYFLTFHLAFYLVYLRRFFVVEVRRGGEHSDPELAVEVRRGTLWSWACGGGPAGNTLIRSLRWRSGGEHFDSEVADGVRRGTGDLELAIEVRRRMEEEGGLT